MASLRLRVLSRIDETSADAWNAVVGPDAVPVQRWEWMSALEASGSATRKTGWQAQHLTLWRDDRLVALAPAWLKFHSMGEYIYDFGWAQAAQALGVDYYPKLLVGVPLSPLTARRFCVREGENVSELRRVLAKAALELAREHASSLHVLFCLAEERDALEELGLFARASLQFHWSNPGYESWEDYLSRFDSKRRHQLRRERGAAAAQGITLRTARGAELDLRHAELAFRLYEATCEKHAWGTVQLSPDFFRRAFAALPDAVEMVLAERAGRCIAGAFNLGTSTHLYGRYWGCFEEHPFLHFNVCLYHSIDDCIRRRRATFEPGAGGEHKISRGFVPTVVHSAHRLFDPRLESVVWRSVAHEREQVAQWAAHGEQEAGLRPWRAAKR